MYRQCELRKVDGDVTVTQVAGIPEKLARKGDFLKLRDKHGDEWDDGWEIVGVYHPLFNQTVSQAMRGHKKRTGDALPKGG